MLCPPALTTGTTRRVAGMGPMAGREQPVQQDQKRPVRAFLPFDQALRVARRLRFVGQMEWQAWFSRESFDKELERLYGFCDGRWSAPVADRFWRVRLVVSVVKARERAVDNFVQGTKAWVDH